MRKVRQSFAPADFMPVNFPWMCLDIIHLLKAVTVK